MRIQPNDIEVPAYDPFQQDLLDRKESVEVLTHLVRSFEGPCVLAVDAAWGNGKTTFLRIWRQYLLNLGFPLVQSVQRDVGFSIAVLRGSKRTMTGKPMCDSHITASLRPSNFTNPRIVRDV